MCFDELFPTNHDHACLRFSLIHDIMKDTGTTAATGLLALNTNSLPCFHGADLGSLLAMLNPSQRATAVARMAPRINAGWLSGQFLKTLYVKKAWSRRKDTTCAADHFAYKFGSMCCPKDVDSNNNPITYESTTCVSGGIVCPHGSANHMCETAHENGLDPALMVALSPFVPPSAIASADDLSTILQIAGGSHVVGTLKALLDVHLVRTPLEGVEDFLALGGIKDEPRAASNAIPMYPVVGNLLPKPRPGLSTAVRYSATGQLSTSNAGSQEAQRFMAASTLLTQYLAADPPNMFTPKTTARGDPITNSAVADNYGGQERLVNWMAKARNKQVRG